jgi:DNA-binding NtrC family response regulator
VDSAITAMKLGAYDYLTKPFKLAELEEVLRRASERKHLQLENAALRRMVDQREPPPVIVGQSQVMKALLEKVQRIAGSDANVLIQGESGTGKGLVARRIHETGPRRRGPFLVINCSGFQDPLLESELFGHEKGAFTGATSVKQGLFEVAQDGTLLLDEVGEMSPAMQAKLLQVLDTRELRRVGGTRLHRVDVRIVAATNTDLAQAVPAGRFREDLYYRLNVISLTLPALRDRREDIPLLVDHFLTRFGGTGDPLRTISPEALRLLVGYAWPGNVRELANAIERLVILAPGPVVTPEDLPPNIRAPISPPPGPTRGPASLSEMERVHIARVLSETGGKKMQAARLLGIDIKTLNQKIKRYNIPL